MKLLMELTFKRRILNCIDELLKVFLHPPPPLERKDFIGIVESMVPKVTILSILKMRL